MYVGVILGGRNMLLHGITIPHVCGGDPHTNKLEICTNEYSPCMWG